MLVYIKLNMISYKPEKLKYKDKEKYNSNSNSQYTNVI